MKISMNWLKDYVQESFDYQTLENTFNLKSQEVEDLYPLVSANSLIIGLVEECIPHENADKLKVCQVNVGNEMLQIICGAPNVQQGQKVIVAMVGAVLPGDFKIKKAKIRGIESHGMICSLDELGIQDFDKKEKGIFVLDSDAPIGKDPLSYMGLDDWVLEVDLTANRQDLLSMRGVAYDVKAMLDVPIKLRKPVVHRVETKKSIEIKTETEDAPVYFGQVISNIKVKESPYWLKSRLLAVGIRPINNVVDITNYVMIEYGQPLHAFDYHKLNSNKIIVRKANHQEVIKTLDETERSLLSSDTVITDGEKPIAIAGVMGGYDTEVDELTTAILLESAVFDPVSVRKTSKRLALKSESSTRFEKGIDHHLTKEALDRACELLEALADATIEGEPSNYFYKENHHQLIDLSIEKINQVTGHSFTKEIIEEMLRRLDFAYQVKGQTYSIEIPSRRIGFESYQDIIEEIVRIYGFNHIGTTLPTTATEGKLTDYQSFKRKIKNLFTHLGFFETNTYALTSLSSSQKFALDKLPLVQIINPLTKDRTFLRQSTIPSLLDVFNYNFSRKLEDVFLIEIGKHYSENSEIELISGLMHGQYLSSAWQKQTIDTDFYLVKGVIERLFNDLLIDNYRFKRPETIINELHPGVAAQIYVNETLIGMIGRLHPEEEKQYGTSHIYVFEMNLEKLFNQSIQNQKRYLSISKFPSVSRDLALVMDSCLEAQSLLDSIDGLGMNTLKSVNVFDVYQGNHLEEGKKSIAMQFVFESQDKTLETAEVDNLIKKIINKLEDDHLAILRK